MSEAEARPAPTRGRSTTRGGRGGGFGRGGARSGRKQSNGASTTSPVVDNSLDDQGELGEMKKKYLSELSMLKELFPDWTEVDLVFALEEAGGDVPSTVDNITQGNVSQFAEVKKNKDRARSKAKDDMVTPNAPDKGTAGVRAGRARGGLEGSRGGRSRGSDRGRGRERGSRGGHATTNGSAKDTGVLSVPTNESTAWDNSANAEAADESWDQPASTALKPAGGIVKGGEGSYGVTPESKQSTLLSGAKSGPPPKGPPVKTWASMLKPAPAPAPAPLPKKRATPQQPPAESIETGGEPHFIDGEAKEKSVELVPATQVIQSLANEHRVVADGDEIVLAPPKAPLTEENVEHLPDTSIPPATQTVASTAGSNDPRNLTPLQAQPQIPIGRPALGGYATAASRLAGTGGRSASYQRRVQEQQEAVVMPGHNAMDRAAVQFGSMGLNGEPGLDVDDEREDPETRLPPQHSPPSQPRTSLPPVPKQPVAQQESVLAEALPPLKQAPGLPPASAQNQQQIHDASLAHNITEDPQISLGFNQPGRYAQSGAQPDASAPQQKPHELFGHQTQHAQFEQYGGHGQQALQQPSQAGFGGMSSAADYSSYYATDAPRNAYNQYYGNSYGPQDARSQLMHSQQDPASAPQRSTSGFGAAQFDSGSGLQGHQQAQSRFGDVQGSGNNTPNPLLGGHHHSAAIGQQSQHSMHPNHQQQGGYGAAANPAYPYGHPYYNSPYQQAYQSQFGFNHQLSSYGGGYPGKQGGMYGGPHNYAMGSQSSFDQHSSSPANAGGFGQNPASMRSASGMGTGVSGGYDEYSRGTAQSSTLQQTSSFGSGNDPFARSGSGAQGSYGQQGGLGAAGADDALKGFGDSKSGPSPALGQPGQRPTSAANSASGQGQSGLPPPQSQQSAAFAGGYSGFQGQGNQYGGGLGGLGSHQSGQGAGGQTGYGSYGAAGFSQTYGNYGGSRGGWGQNYGVH